jgi:hypothetical protein
VLQTSVAMALVPPDAQKTPHGQLAARIALGITWAGLVSGRGHRKDQFRVLGSPSALHASSFPPGSFLGAIQRLFFRRAVFAVERGRSTQAHRSCLLVGHSAPL